MSSLHDAATILTYATACRNIWADWLKPPNAGATAMDVTTGRAQRKLAREVAFRNAINAACGFMTPPAIQFENLGPGVCGWFSWTAWTLYVNTMYTGDDLTYNDFFELCVTCYHETRHCEQFFRMAQGLASGTLLFPDKTNAEIVSEAAAFGGGGVGGGVSNRIAMFNAASGGATAALNGSLPATGPARVALLTKWLNIPAAAAQAGEGAKGGYAAFIAGAAPDWFKRSTIKLEVEEWLRATYKRTLFGTTMEAQRGGGSSPGMYRMYADLSVEVDAHGIEVPVVEKIEQAVNVPRAGNGAKLRGDAAFNAIP